MDYVLVVKFMGGLCPRMLAMSGFLATSGRYQTEVKHSEKTRTRSNTNPTPKVFDSLVNFCLNNIIVDRVTDPKDGRDKKNNNTHTYWYLLQQSTQIRSYKTSWTNMDNSDYLTLKFYYPPSQIKKNIN